MIREDFQADSINYQLFREAFNLDLYNYQLSIGKGGEQLTKGCPHLHA